MISKIVLIGHSTILRNSHNTSLEFRNSMVNQVLTSVT